MSLRTSATRYARALFEVAVKESDPVHVEQGLAAIADAMTTHADLRRVMLSPSVPQAVRVSIVREVVSRAGVDPIVNKLLVMLADRGRLELVPDLLVVYRERVLAHQNIVSGSVAAATPLAAEALAALEQRLGAATGKQVQLTATVDPSLIGGVVATIGSTVYDGSVRTQLQKMKQQLVESA